MNVIISPVELPANYSHHLSYRALHNPSSATLTAEVIFDVNKKILIGKILNINNNIDFLSMSMMCLRMKLDQFN